MVDPRDGHPDRPGDARDATAAAVAAVLTTPGTRFAVAGHHNPDGDALGSMLGLHRSLVQAGFDSVLCHPDADPRLPEMEFMFAPGDAIGHGPPPDAAERVLVAVDCASAERLWQRDGQGPHVGFAGSINIDHHHDNTRFAQLNLVVPDASSSAEVVYTVLRAAGLPVDAAVATPLYVGLITDTGRFSYSNTGAEAHRVAAALIEAGTDPHAVSQALYEDQPLDRVMLAARALGKMRAVAGGRLRVAVLGPEDFAAAGGDDSEGIVELMRSIEGCVAAGLARETAPGHYRVSLRSSVPELDVSLIARAEGGGGHKAAAGFSTGRDIDEMMQVLERKVIEQLGPVRG